MKCGDSLFEMLDECTASTAEQQMEGETYAMPERHLFFQEIAGVETCVTAFKHDVSAK
jgi:hypothetical protein